MLTAPEIHPWLLTAAAGVVAVLLAIFVVRLVLGAIRGPIAPTEEK